MKKNLFKFMLIFCLILPISFLFTGCGENLIVDGKYQLINIQVIRDNNYFDNPHADGSFIDHILGDVTLDKCMVDVSTKECHLTFTDDESKLKATYSFVRYNDKSQYPAFKCNNYEVVIDGVNVKQLTEEDKSAFNNEYANLLDQTLLIGENFLENKTSLQLATFNQTFTGHLIIKDAQDNLLLLAMVYGY